MPKELYYALDEHKKQAIFQAALDEFTQHPFSAASINQIIKHAGIARGSFYLYFEDKLDLYIHTNDWIMDKRTDQFLAQLPVGTLDVFRLYRYLFAFNLQFLAIPRYAQYAANLYMGMIPKVWQHIQCKQAQLRERLLPRTCEADSPRMAALVRLIELSNRELLRMKLVDALDDDMVMQQYDLHIGILQDGWRHTIDNELSE